MTYKKFVHVVPQLCVRLILVLFKLFGVVNKGRRVTLKYFNTIDKEHRLFIAPGQSISLI